MLESGEGEVYPLHVDCDDRDGEGPQFFLWFCLEQSGYVIEDLHLSGMSLYYSFAERAGFAWAFLICPCWHFPVVCFSSTS